MNFASIFYFVGSIVLFRFCSAQYGSYFTENQVENVLKVLNSVYVNNIINFKSIEAVISAEQSLNFFFYSDDKIIPSLAGTGKQVNIYFYKNNNKKLESIENMDNLSSYDLVFTETKEDLQNFIEEANQVLVKLANESKYVPLIRILGSAYQYRDRIMSLTERIRGELPFKEYIQEALPIFKTKNITVAPRADSENVAVIVESAVHPALELVVRNVMYYLKSGWSLIIYHSEENEYFIKNALKDLPNIEYRLPFSPIYSVAEYNQFMKNYNFYESLKAKKVLIFQTDSIMLKSGIERFMQYDYAGAPWHWLKTSGNGGFSLRTVDVMMEACRLACNNRNRETNEDLIFAGFVSRNYKLVPYNEAYAFSREQRDWTLDYMTAEGGILDGHMALHQTWLNTHPYTMRKILNYSLEQLKKEN